MSLMVSLPASAYKTAPANSPVHLHSRLLKSSEIPEGWKLALDTKADESTLHLSRPLQQSGDELVLTISGSLSWTLTVGTFSVNMEDCPLLQGVSASLQSVDQVIGLLRELNTSKLCAGNPDERFMAMHSAGWC